MQQNELFETISRQIEVIYCDCTKKKRHSVHMQVSIDARLYVGTCLACGKRHAYTKQEIAEFNRKRDTEEEQMGVTDYLKGFTPEVNEDGAGFEVLDGTYAAKVNYLRPERSKDGVYDRYRAEFEITEVLKGNGNPARKLWKTYYKDNEESVRALVNDLFTAGITLDTSSDEAFEASFENAIGKKVYLRCWGWTPEKKKDGTAIPVEERTTRQQFIVKTEKDARSGGKKSEKKASSVPF